MRKHERLQIKEKRLDIEQWRCGTDFQRGSHFPLCVFTDNSDRRRSPESIQAREKRTQERAQRNRQGRQQWWWNQSWQTQEWSCEELAQQIQSRAQAQTPWAWYNPSPWQQRFEQIGVFDQTAVAASTTAVAGDVTPRGHFAHPAVLLPSSLDDPVPVAVSPAAPSPKVDETGSMTALDQPEKFDLLD